MSDTTKKTAALWRLDEQVATLGISDASEQLDDMVGDAGAGLVLPDVVPAALGYGREGGAGKGAIVVDADDVLQLTRDMAVIWIGKLDLASMIDGDVAVVAARGVQGSAAERILWRAECERISATIARLRMGWQDPAGTDAVVLGADFVVPAGFCLFACVRRWISESEVEITYVLNDRVIGVVTSTDGDIDGGSGGTVTLMCAGDGVGGYEDFWSGVVDQVHVTKVAITVEELVATYRRIFRDQPDGYSIVRALLPRGRAFDRIARDAVAGKLFAVMGDALGYALGFVRGFAEGFLPHRAWDWLEDWEQLLGVGRNLHDSIAVRRERVLAFLRRVHGYNRDGIRVALADVFAMQAESIPIVAGTNTWIDEFDNPEPASFVPAWIPDVANGSHAKLTSAAEMQVNAADARWISAAIRNAPTITLALADGEDAQITAKISAATILADYFGGIFLQDFLTGDVHWFGIHDSGAGDVLAHATLINGVYTAPATLLTPAPALPVWLRMRALSATQEVRLYYSTTDEDSGYTQLGGDLPSVAAQYAGLFLASTVAAPAGIATITCDRFRAWTPNGRETYNWFAHRPPSWPGTPDMIGAQQVVEKLRPAESYGFACEELALACDEPTSLCDRDKLR